MLGTEKCSVKVLYKSDVGRNKKTSLGRNFQSIHINHYWCWWWIQHWKQLSYITSDSFQGWAVRRNKIGSTFFLSSPLWKSHVGHEKCCKLSGTGKHNWMVFYITCPTVSHYQNGKAIMMQSTPCFAHLSSFPGISLIKYSSKCAFLILSFAWLFHNAKGHRRPSSSSSACRSWSIYYVLSLTITGNEQLETKINPTIDVSLQGP